MAQPWVKITFSWVIYSLTTVEIHFILGEAALSMGEILPLLVVAKNILVICHLTLGECYNLPMKHVDVQYKQLFCLLSVGKTFYNCIRLLVVIV